MGVETFWVSDIHPGEPDEYGKGLAMEVVRASDYDELRTTLARALHLLWIGIEVGLDPVEKDEATALFVKYGDGEAFTGSLHEIIGVDMAKGSDVTVTQGEHSGESVNPPRDPRDGHAFWDPHNEGSCYSCGCGPDVHRAPDHSPEGR